MSMQPPNQMPGQTPAYGPPQNGMGTAALVMGILQFFCLGLVGSILAIVFGKTGMNRAEQGLATNGGVAKAGYILGIIGIVVWVISLIIFLIAAANGAFDGTVFYSR
ncbi:MAG: DUF4190 domain-containing protein [Candidatus Nanopelagicales bacterium]